MKKALQSICRNTVKGFLFLSLVFLSQSYFGSEVNAQIYEPEGLNMPGAWNSWTNPPVNNLALASSTQVTGGRIVKIAVGTTRWQSSFSVAATGADLIGGTYEWLFTSGPSTNAFGNKWANVTVAMNTLQTYTKEGANNNSVTLVDGKWYTVNWEDLGYVDCRAVFMPTSAQPVSISAVSVPSAVSANSPATINVTLSQSKSAEEIIYTRYTTDDWATSTALVTNFTGTSGTVVIPGQAAGTVVSYYAFSSTVADLAADFDLYTLKLNNNGDLNYSYTVAPPPPAITWANLQYPASGAIETGDDFMVFGQAYIPGVSGQATVTPGLVAWVGYSTSNTNPDTWTNWIPAPYYAAAGNNDEFSANLGTAITAPGTYYYATRFQLNTDPYVYGGFDGGFWNGTSNISGTLTVTDPIPVPDFDWVNLQHPANGSIEPSQEFLVYAQAYIQGVTGQATAAPGVTSWIGYSTTNSNPATWTNWVVAPYSAAAGNNDEFIANIGAQISTAGTYYYASRFRLNSGDYYYGGYSATGGGFWDGTNNVSGVLTVSAPVGTFPVLFTIIDGTLNNTNIKLKGQMTDWDTVSMTNNNHTWTHTLTVAPGTYEWGAIEDDGTATGIWLITGPNLVFTVDSLGVISGTVTYTTLITGMDELVSVIRIFPNPAADVLFLELPQNASVRITDMQGKLMLQQNYSNGNHQIDISGLKSGLYTVETISGNSVQKQKIIKK